MSIGLAFMWKNVEKLLIAISLGCALVALGYYMNTPNGDSFSDRIRQDSILIEKLKNEIRHDTIEVEKFKVLRDSIVIVREVEKAKVKDMAPDSLTIFIRNYINDEKNFIRN